MKQYKIGDKINIGNKVGKVIDRPLSSFSLSARLIEVLWNTGDNDYFHPEHLEKLEEKEDRYYNKYVGWGEELNES